MLQPKSDSLRNPLRNLKSVSCYVLSRRYTLRAEVSFRHGFKHVPIVRMTATRTTTHLL